MSRVIGLLSFYDEAPEMLIRSIASFKPLLDELVVVDGRYAHFAPDSEAYSSSAQHEALNFVCRSVGLPMTIHTPMEPFESEVAKRSFLFKLGLAHAEINRDWLLVFDADEALTKFDLDKADLAAIEEDVIELGFDDPGNPDIPALRMLFRALDGLTVKRAHYRYFAGDGRCLWGDAVDDPVDAHDLSSKVSVYHLNHHREQERAEAARTYYRYRDGEGYEFGPCFECKTGQGEFHLPYDLQLVEEGVSSMMGHFCRDCVRTIRYRNKKALKKAGLDESAKCMIGGKVITIGSFYPTPYNTPEPAPANTKA